MFLIAARFKYYLVVFYKVNKKTLQSPYEYVILVGITHVLPDILCKSELLIFRKLWNLRIFQEFFGGFYICTRQI